MAEDEMNVEDIAITAYNKVDALLDLLIKKKIITEKEFDEAEDALYEEIKQQE